MKLQQLRFFCEVVDQGFNISRASETLFTSQPGISRQLGLLESELGTALIVRRGNRLTGLTPAGTQVLEQVKRILNCMDTITSIGCEFENPLRGSLTIATTHTHARYVLPGVIQKFVAQYPEVSVKIIQGLPNQILNWVMSGEADLGLTTRPAVSNSNLAVIPCYEVDHLLIAPLGNPLLKERALTLEKVGQYPFIAYDDTYQISRQILEKMRAAGVSPNVVMRASDSDVIKTYVATGLGVAIIPSVAYDSQTDRSIGAKGLGKAFHRTMACILVRKGSSLRSFAYAFLKLLPSSFTNEVIDAAIKY